VQALQAVLGQARCGLPVSKDASTGGVLLLGSAVWIEGTWPRRSLWTGGWRQIDEDLRRAKVDFELRKCLGLFLPVALFLHWA